MKQPEYVDATFYVQVQPSWSRYYSNDDPRLEGAKAVQLTQSKPRRPQGGTVLTKLTIRIPAGAFLPLRPEAIVVIPESMTAVNPIEVTAEEPE
jgi:hypothetical protein